MDGKGALFFDIGSTTRKHKVVSWTPISTKKKVRRFPEIAIFRVDFGYSPLERYFLDRIV